MKPSDVFVSLYIIIAAIIMIILVTYGISSDYAGLSFLIVLIDRVLGLLAILALADNEEAIK